MEKLLKHFNACYSFLYENSEKKSVESIVIMASELFDLKLKHEDDFRDLVGAFVDYRRDFISSDRESAAFILALTYEQMNTVIN